MTETESALRDLFEHLPATTQAEARLTAWVRTQAKAGPRSSSASWTARRAVHGWAVAVVVAVIFAEVAAGLVGVLGHHRAALTQPGLAPAVPRPTLSTSPCATVSCAPTVPSQPPAVTRPGTVLPVAVRRTAPPLSADVIGGGRFTLADARGHLVVIGVVASWCVPCAGQLRSMQSVLSSEVRVVAFDVKEVQPPQSAVAWEHALGATFPMITDPGSALRDQFVGTTAGALPETMVVDRAGRIAARYAGAVSSSELARAVASLSAE